MKTRIQIFESGICDGIISRNKKFYKEDLTEEEIEQLFLQNRIELGKKYNFDGKKIFQALQKTATNGIDYPDGKYIILTEEHMQKDDFWYEKLPCDILIISKKHPKIVVGNQMADCPIIIVEDRRLGVTALSHCGVSYIDRLLPIQTVKALVNAYKSNLQDLYVTITSCAKKDKYIYQTYPRWATNETVWKNSIIKEKDGYHIDMTNAILEQLRKIGIINIEVISNDTITNPYFYSHKASIDGDTSKFGQNFVGFFYK